MIAPRAEHPPVPTPTYLRTKQAAALLGISVRTLYRLIEAGRIGYVRVSERGIRLRREHLERYLAANTHEPEQDKT